MSKRSISNLDLKVKLTNEYLNNGGVEKIFFPELLEDLLKVQSTPNGKVDPDSVTPSVNAFMLAILHSHLNPPACSEKFISEYASTLQKTNSFTQQNIDTVEQFNALYDKYKIKEGLLFRGQNEAKWRLYSRLQRAWIADKIFDKNVSYQEFIERMVELGQETYMGEIIEVIQNGEQLTKKPIAILGFLQHHGCPTPLLDWTYKFQNALFFAFDGLAYINPKTEIDHYCSVYYIEEKYMESGGMRTLINTSLDSLEKKFKGKFVDLVTNDKRKRRELKNLIKKRALFDRAKIQRIGLVNHLTQIERMINMPLIYFTALLSEQIICKREELRYLRYTTT